MKIKKGKNSEGFTLFELLVSISIIAVLTAIAIVSFGGLNRKTRDARRIADLEKIRLALEAARQIGNTYPSNLSALVGSSLLDKIPTDPKSIGTTYVYSIGASNYSYRICAYVEDTGSTTADVGGCSGLPGGYSGYYKVIQP